VAKAKRFTPSESVPTVPVPSDLHSLHRFVAARIEEDQERAVRAKRERWPHRSLCATELDRRELRLTSALLDAFEKRGHRLEHEKGSLFVWAVIGGERIDFSVFEYVRQRRIPLTAAELKKPENVRSDRKWRQAYEATGQLVIEAKARIGAGTRYRWFDSDAPLEDQLGAVVLGAEALARESASARAKMDQSERDWQRKARERAEQHAMFLREERHWEAVREMAADWSETIRLRQFVDAIAARLTNHPDRGEQAQAWLRWARDRIAALDPLVRDADAILDAICSGDGCHRPSVEPDDADEFGY